jgi:surface antigen
MATRSAFLAACRAEIGYAEVPTNRTKFAAQAGHPNGNPWCLTFLVAKARQVGLKLPGYGAYTPTMAQQFKNIGAYGKTPRVGAFMFVYFPSMGRIAHVGVVEAVNADGTITTIEGNSNSAGSRTGGSVVRHRRSLTNLTFGYPAYSAEAAPKPTTTKPNPYATPVLSSSRPFISAASKKTANEIRWIEWACKRSVTGTWSSALTTAVKAFQKAHGLLDDGKVGPKTLAAMKAVRR